ncbi:MAG: hypothetical protein GEU71_04615 [Actinobacteria bacterium]|nr:hypothetical protein [Actinomycetota bacterium]
MIQSIDVNVASAHPDIDDELTVGQEMVLGFLVVCRKNMRGIRLLLIEDHAEQARILGRTLLIDCHLLLHLLRHNERLEELRVAFELGCIRDQRNLIAELEEHYGSKKNDIEALKVRLNDHEAALRLEAKELGVDENDLVEDMRLLMSAERLLKSSPQPESYAQFRFSSHAVHTSSLTLSMHKQIQADGSIHLTLGDRPESVLSVGLTSAQLFLFGYRAAAELLGWDTIETIREFFDYTKGELEQLLGDTGIGGMEEFIGVPPTP